MTKAHPFENDGEFLNEAAKWLRARAVRLAVERELRDAQEEQQAGEESRRGQSVQQLRCRVVTQRERVDKLYDEWQARVNVHRMSDKPTLGLDAISGEPRLPNGDERLILLTLTLSCLGSPLADQVCGELFTCFGGHTQVSDVVKLLGAVEPSEWLHYRNLFLPNSPLLRDGHIKYDRVPQGPEDVMDANIAICRETFALICGTDPEPESYAPQGGQR